MSTDDADAAAPRWAVTSNSVWATLIPDPHQQIEELEAELDALTEAAERCSRPILAAKLVVAIGGVSLLVGLFRSEAVALVVGIAIMLGALALWGSTRSTRDVIRASLRAREAQRAEMIDELALQVVHER